MRTARRFVLSFVLALFALAPAGLRAQEPGFHGSAPAASGAADPSVSPQAPGAAPSSGLPQRAAPPRTLRDYTHVFVAFAVAWLLLFGYVVSLGRRWSAVERELAARA